MVKDDLRVGGITVEGQAIEIAESIDQSFVSGAGDGLLGLAFGDLNSVRPQQVKTPVENMIAQNDISENQELFTCKLGSWKDREDEPDRRVLLHVWIYRSGDGDGHWRGDILHPSLPWEWFLAI